MSAIWVYISKVQTKTNAIKIGFDLASINRKKKILKVASRVYMIR